MAAEANVTSPGLVRLMVLGLNHKTAPLEVRERLAFTADDCRAALASLRQEYGSAEAVLLSTCNRVELYLARPLHGQPTVETAAAFLARQRGLDPSAVQGHLYHHEDRAAIEHLFFVASSLDSMVLGETQILAQVKAAYQLGVESGTVGGHDPSAGAVGDDTGGADPRLFHSLFQRAIAAAKEVHDSTELSSGRLSIASVAIDLARGVFDRFEDKTVVCIGAGEMANLMLTHLRDLKPKRLMITNRSFGRAETLAREFNAEPVAISELPELLVEADIVLTSTGATEPVVTEGMFKALLKRRRYRPVVMIDIAVPRDIEAAVGKLSNVYLYNIDDLQDVASANRVKRDAAVADSAEIIKRHVDDFTGWLSSRDVGPVVKALYAHANGLAQGELELLFSRHLELTPEQRGAVEKMTHRLVNKLLHPPVNRITQHSEASGRPFLVAALRKLFGI